MKRTIVAAIASIAVAMLNGCDPHDPVVSPDDSHETPAESALSKLACGGQIALGEKIPFGVITPNPSGINQFAYLDGNINYAVGPLPVLQRGMLSVSLEFDAGLHQLDGTDPVWIFSSSSTDQVSLSVADPTLLLKTYQAQGPSSIVTLYVRYEVTNCRVTVNSMWAVKTIFPIPGGDEM